MLGSARFDKGLDVTIANNIVGDMVESLLRNPDALMLLRNLRTHDTEAEAHALSTSILSLEYLQQGTGGLWFNMACVVA